MERKNELGEYSKWCSQEEVKVELRAILRSM